MGASLTMIDRHYGHLAKDGRQHAIDLLDAQNVHDVHAVDARWTHGKVTRRRPGENAPLSRTNPKAL